MIFLKRASLLLVVMSMVLGGAVGCKEKVPDAESVESTESTGTPLSGTEILPNDKDDLPEDLDFDGATITLYSYVQEESTREMFQGDYSTDAVQQAMYLRNTSLEYRLNCDIEIYERVGDTNQNTVSDDMEKIVSSGSTLYSIVATAGFQMCNMVLKGYYQNLANLNYIDFDKDYYSQGYNEALSVGDAQYLVTGKFSLSFYRYMIPMLFNKTLFTNAGVEYPYQTVIDGDWDFEEVARLSALFDADLDGDGMDVDDRYGYAMWVGSGSSHTDGYMASSGLHALGKTKDNLYRNDLSSTADFSNAIDNILKMMYAEGSYTSSTYFDHIQKFSQGTVAMTSFRIFYLEDERFRELGYTGNGYGILPSPKSDSETQADYYSYIQDQNILYGIPMTLTGENAIRASQFLEAYACAGYASVRPVYYEKLLTTRYVSDPQSVRMIQMMEDSVVVDPANVYIGAAGVKMFSTTQLRYIYADGTNTVASLLEGNKDIISEGVINLNLQFEELLKKLG